MTNDTLDFVKFPPINTKENKIKVIDMFIEKAESEFQYNKDHKNYALINQNYGFMKGLIEGRDHLTIKHFLNIGDAILWAETQFNIEFSNREYGKCDFWNYYISALKVCSVIIESGEIYGN